MACSAGREHSQFTYRHSTQESGSEIRTVLPYVHRVRARQHPARVRRGTQETHSRLR